MDSKTVKKWPIKLEICFRSLPKILWRTSISVDVQLSRYRLPKYATILQGHHDGQLLNEIFIYSKDITPSLGYLKGWRIFKMTVDALGPRASLCEHQIAQLQVREPERTSLRMSLSPSFPVHRHRQLISKLAELTPVHHSLKLFLVGV